MRKTSNLNPSVNIAQAKMKPVTHMQYCGVCSYDNSSEFGQTKKECINCICLDCRAEGHTLESALKDIESIPNDSTCLDCGNKLGTGKSKHCDECREEGIRRAKNKRERIKRRNEVKKAPKKAFKICARCDTEIIPKNYTYCKECAAKQKKETVARFNANHATTRYCAVDGCETVLKRKGISYCPVCKIVKNEEVRVRKSEKQRECRSKALKDNQTVSIDK